MCMCGAAAGCMAINHQSLCRVKLAPELVKEAEAAREEAAKRAQQLRFQQQVKINLLPRILDFLHKWPICGTR